MQLDEVVQQAIGTIIAGEVGADGDGIHLYFDDGRVLILIGIVDAHVGRVRSETLQ